MEFLFFAEASIKSNQKIVHCLRIKVGTIDALFQDEATGKTVIVCGENWYWVKESLDRCTKFRNLMNFLNNKSISWYRRMNPKLFLREYQYCRILHNDNESTFEFNDGRIRDQFAQGLISLDIPHKLFSRPWGELGAATYIIEDWERCQTIYWMIKTPSITARKKSLFLIACCKHLKLASTVIKVLEDFVEDNTTVRHLENAVNGIADSRSVVIISDVAFALRYIKDRNPRHSFLIDDCLTGFYKEAPYPHWQCDILRHLVKRERFV